MIESHRILGLPFAGVFLAFALAFPQLRAGEFFVSKSGSDGNDGLAESRAFATIQHGVSALKPGDTLTILPGEYTEAVSIERKAGTPEAPIVIRAQRSGTVLLRGDATVEGWKAVDGRLGVYSVPSGGPVTGVSDPTTQRVMFPVTSISEVEMGSGAFYHDQANGMLYVKTPNVRQPAFLTVSRGNSSGFALSECKHMVLEGLGFTGFQHADNSMLWSSRTRWGIIAVRGEWIVIRNCSAYLNSGGICLISSANCVVERCIAFANHSRTVGIANQILGQGCRDSVFRENLVWALPGSGLGASQNDISFYSNSGATNLMENNVVVEGGFMDKGDADHVQVRNNLSVGSRPAFYRKPDASNLAIPYENPRQLANRFADPWNFDFRLLVDSPLRRTGPQGADPGPVPFEDNVFFVSPRGDDVAPGNSPGRPWKTIAHASARARPGDTIYLMEGVYKEALQPGKSGRPEAPIRYVRYAQDKVVLNGDGKMPLGIELRGVESVHVVGLEVRGFTVAGAVISKASDVEISYTSLLENGGDAIQILDSRRLRVRNNLISAPSGAGLSLSNSPGAILEGNLFLDGAKPLMKIDEQSLAGLCSNRNNFSPNASGGLVVKGNTVFQSLSEWQVASGGLDAESLSILPDFEKNPVFQASFTLPPDSPLIGRGPQSGPIGPFLRIVYTVPVVIENASVRSVTATTANIEGWTPGAEVEVSLSWGQGNSTAQTIRAGSGIFHTISLTGLEPGTDYSARMSTSARQISSQFSTSANRLPIEAGSKPATAIQFRTPGSDPEPTTFYVSQSGDDTRDGLTPQTAWRSIEHAAKQVVAGDTVLILDGTYEELIRPRGTGESGRPVTFRAAPGAVVWITGSDRQRETAFHLQEKSFLVLDGLRFRDFASPESSDGDRVITIRGGANNAVKRCFYDGRVLSGYMNVFLSINESPRFLLENCVMILGMGEGLSINSSPDSHIRHCVFYIQNIRAMTIASDQNDNSVSLSHNLFVDPIPSKGTSGVLRIGQLSNLTSNHNGFFVRSGRSEDERVVVETHNIGNEVTWTMGSGMRNGLDLNLAQLREKAGQDLNSIFGNPGIRVVSELVPRYDDDSRPLTFPQKRKPHEENELHLVNGKILPLDFADFFADPSGPFAKSAAGKPIGLDPSAFESVTLPPSPMIEPPVSSEPGPSPSPDTEPDPAPPSTPTREPSLWDEIRKQIEGWFSR